MKINSPDGSAFVPPFKFRKWVQHLHVRVDSFWSMEHPVIPLDISDLEWLLNLKPEWVCSKALLPAGDETRFEHWQTISSKGKHSTCWQANFMPLRTLEVDVCFIVGPGLMQDRTPVYQCVSEHTPGLLSVINACNAELKAKRVEVLVAVEGCRRAGALEGYPVRRDPEMVRRLSKPDCGCEEVVEDALKALFR